MSHLCMTSKYSALLLYTSRQDAWLSRFYSNGVAIYIGKFFLHYCGAYLHAVICLSPTTLSNIIIKAKDFPGFSVNDIAHTCENWEKPALTLPYHETHVLYV